MNAFKCDICGKFFERSEEMDNYDYSICKWINGHGGRWKALDLCDECQTKLILFIKGEDVHE